MLFRSAPLVLTQCTSVTTHSPPAKDPYGSVPAPPIPASCSSFPNSGTASPGKFCGGVTINGTVNLNPGVYVISGGTLKVNASAKVSGSGVMFYLTNGATLQFNGNSHFNLSAATSGTYQGLLFFSDRNDPYVDQTINGNATSIMTGAMYFPSQNAKDRKSTRLNSSH